MLPPEMHDDGIGRTIEPAALPISLRQAVQFKRRFCPDRGHFACCGKCSVLRVPCPASSRNTQHSRNKSRLATAASRLDVLVQPEQVFRVILCFERGQPFILGAKALAHRVVALLQKAGEVQIAAAIREGRQVGDARAHPVEIGVVVLGVLPAGFRADQKGRMAPMKRA